MLIADLPEHERPREKLLARGPAALSDAELLALILRTGQKGQSAVALAQSWLNQHALPELMRLDFKAAKRLSGMGLARFAELHGALEFGRRVVETDLQRGERLTPDSVRTLLRRILKLEQKEVMLLVAVNSQMQFLGTDVLARGSISSVHVSTREMVESALKMQAHSVILAHNHPSGARRASEADWHLTERARQALATVDIPLLDHFIVADGEPISLSESAAQEPRTVALEGLRLR